MDQLFSRFYTTTCSETTYGPVIYQFIVFILSLGVLAVIASLAIYPGVSYLLQVYYLIEVFSILSLALG